MVEADYSMINNVAETNGFMQFCQEKGIVMMTRGPLAKGLLSGRYNLNTEFTDTIRVHWNKGGKQREEYEAFIAKLDAIKEKLTDMNEMDLATYAVRYILSQPVGPIAIPGATSVAQVIANAKAGERLLTAQELRFEINGEHMAGGRRICASLFLSGRKFLRQV